jgi:hypothetical protein
MRAVASLRDFCTGLIFGCVYFLSEVEQTRELEAEFYKSITLFVLNKIILRCRTCFDWTGDVLCFATLREKEPVEL